MDTELKLKVLSDAVVSMSPATLLKEDSGTGVFLWIWRNL